MKVALKAMTDGHNSWSVYKDNTPIKPIDRYLNYLYHLQKSPNTIRAYAYHLFHYWQYIQTRKITWYEVKIEELAAFITWLRSPSPDIVVVTPSASIRAESSINAALAAVTAFYKFHEQLGNISGLDLYHTQIAMHQKYKPLLHHLNSTIRQQSRILKVKKAHTIPEVLTSDEIRQILSICYSKRDTFLVHLLFETGMRIGQVLALHHSDIKSFDNEIHIIPRVHYRNDARNKSSNTNILHVTPTLMQFYSDYVINELSNIPNQPYVFVALKGVRRAQPLKYASIQDLFQRFSKVLNKKITPHMFRHTHATMLMRTGWDMALIQKRLGHKSIQTTISTYIHYNNDDLKQAFKQYEDLCNETK